MGWNQLTVCLLAVLVVFAGVPASVAATPEDVTNAHSTAALQAVDATQTNASAANDSTVNVTVGQQLSTVIATTSDDVQSEVESTGFEVEYENRSDEARAEVIAERGDRLAERAEAIRAEYENATEAYEAGALTRSEYAQRLATLNARAENVVAGYEQVEDRSAAVSALELRAAGLNRTALERAVDDLDSVRGTGAAALLQRFTGTDTGEIELETSDGLSVEVEGEDGEFSREITRDRDDDAAITVAQSAALETARGALSAPTNASWTLQSASVHEDSGYYKFEFGFQTAEQTGEAEVRVDGSSGAVFRVEEEVEPTEAAEDEREDAEDAEDEREDAEDAEDEREDAERDNDEFALLVADGTVAAGETIQVQVLQAGDPAADVPVSMNGESVGTTGADGTVAVTLPASGDAELTAGEGELELELRESDDDVYRNLRADAELADGTVTVTVTYDGSGVANATVYANDQRVGTTGGDGTASFAVPNGTDELDVEVEKGEFEAEFEYELRDGALTQTDDADAGDDDAEEEDAAEDADEDDADETEDTEEDDVDGDDADETEDTEEDDEDDAEDADDEDDADDLDADDEDETETPEADD